MSDGNGTTTIEAVPGTITKEEFNGVTSTALAETASTAVAAQATAAVQARYVMAMKRPRDWDDVRVNLLKECRRPRFAQVARYLKPIGKGVTGPSIRFVEAALRCMGNVYPETMVVHDDREKRIIRQSITDLEGNVTYATDIVVEKTVERSKPRDGVPPISVRTNSAGQKTYLVEATDDDLLNKVNALVSKAMRTNGLRLLPGDILDECMDLVVATQETEDAQDPDAARKRLVDAFTAIGVKPSDVKQYLGHELSTSSPAELVELRGVFAAIKDGETNWKDTLDAKLKARQEAPEAPKAVTVKDRVAEAKAKAQGKPAGKPGEVPHDAATGELIEVQGTLGSEPKTGAA